MLAIGFNGYVVQGSIRRCPCSCKCSPPCEFFYNCWAWVRSFVVVLDWHLKMVISWRRTFVARGSAARGPLLVQPVELEVAVNIEELLIFVVVSVVA